MMYKILIVDDEAANLRLLERLFRRQYQVMTALSGSEALELLNQHDFSLIISDQRMPGMTGIEFLKRAAEIRPHTVRIILTGYTDINALVEAVNSGVVYKYVTKPWVNEDLQQTIARALQHYETIKNQYELKLQNQRLSETLERTRQGLVRLIADTLDAKDEFSHGHARRTAGYAAAIGRRFGLESLEIEQLSLAAFLHKAGYLGIFNCFSHKLPRFTGEEYNSVKHNFERVEQVLAGVPDINEIVSAIRYQYENFDGSGFPEGLRGKQIPLFARIISIACAYDEMTSPGLSDHISTHDEAIERLRANTGKQFDKEVFELFSGIKPLGKIRQAIAKGINGMQLYASRILFEQQKFPENRVISKTAADPMLALEVIKLANLLTPMDPTWNIPAAAAKVGESRVRQLIAQNGLPSPDEKIEKWSLRSARRAQAAKLLAEKTNFIKPDDAYTLGLLFEVGEILLANLFPEEILALEKYEDRERFQQMTEIFGVDSIQVSQWMLEAFGFPAQFTRAVQSPSELMRVNNPLSLLLQTAFQITWTKSPHNAILTDSVSADIFEILKLNRTELNIICEGIEETNFDYVKTKNESIKSREQILRN